MLAHSTLTSIPDDFICDDRKSLVRDCITKYKHSCMRNSFFFLFVLSLHRQNHYFFTRECSKLIIWVVNVSGWKNLSPIASTRNSSASQNHWGSAQTCRFNCRRYQEFKGPTRPLGLHASPCSFTCSYSLPLTFRFVSTKLEFIPTLRNALFVS